MNILLTVLFTSCLVIVLDIRLLNASLRLDDLKETKFENKLNNLLTNITKNDVFGQFMRIIMSEDYTLSWFLDDLIKQHLFCRWSITITNSSKQVIDISSKLPDAYVILFNNYQSLIQLSNVLHNASESWNPEARFLLITTMYVHPKPVMDELLINIFNFLWSRNAIRVSLIVINESEQTASLLSSSPYSKLYKTCKKILNFSQIQKFNLVNDVIPLNTISGYQFETPSSFLGCPLVGHTFPFPPYSIEDNNSSSGCRVYNSGIEVQLVKLMANVYNFSLEIITTPSYGTANEWLYIYTNGSRKGMLEDIMQNEIDLAFAGVIPPSLFYFKLGMTNTYIDSSMSWYVPAAELIPVWKLVLNTFSGLTWLFMLTMFFIVTLLNYLIIRFERNEHVDEEPIGLTMVALSLGFSTKWTKRPHLRIILLAWSLFCFHVALMFNTRLFSVLTEPPFDLQIETVQQLHGTRLKTCTYSSYKLFFTNRTEGIMKYLIGNAQNCDNLDESVKLLLKYKNFSILAKDDLMTFKIDNKIDKIHQMKYDKFIRYPVVMPVAKGSVFLGILNRLVFNITESGLVFKWLNDVRRTFKNKLFTREVQAPNTENYLISKEDFVWLYFVFLGGQATAFIVFLFEIYVKSIR